ncbi:hypothetical protein PHISCL_04321 [Aspergillus sclerotialis]|uniref:Something about silencing protein 4 domain-containing protein n=1 Tax=Aspergillus sclerotialis TaxID=2070753 RepID=A0A3A2ZZK1_9EURO|nr:hypothetical protein PHISCL_04321 [Aspergillus sclerotialis]
MAILSKPSFRRPSVRQEDSIKDPSKALRRNPNPNPSTTSAARRKSSPDLLETAIDSDSDKSRQVGLFPSNSPIPPNSSIRRPPPAHPPAPHTPSASAALSLQGDRDSPDPLDTITPVTNARSGDLDPVLKPSPVSRSTTSLPPAAVDLPTETPAGSQKTCRKRRKSSSQPATAATDTSPVIGRRSLRSQDVDSRAKCELSNYFLNYEELLSLAPPKPEFLAGDTAVNIIDDLSEPLTLPSNPTNTSPFGNPLEKLHNCDVVELPEPEPYSDSEDPLNDEVYFRPHRRVERQEKQLRNIERERSQHEKQQVDRLLLELKGHDWIRVMGLTNLSDAEKKLYEPKRSFFIKELSLLIEKFNIWRDEERRRKFGKEKAFIRANTSPPTAAKANETGSKRRTSGKHKRTHDEMTSEAQLNGTSPFDAASSNEPPDINDVDAWAARQLHQEARSAFGKRLPSSTERRKSKSRRTDTQSDLPPAPPVVDENKPFTSFYSNPATRATALSSSKDRKPGTKSYAFGQIIPPMKEGEFELPPDILTEEAIQASRRRLRRLRRERRE